ncbi:MAG: hypothetical protein MUO52_16465, partial [Desulfobacterales bacterium]|nr:hypothetical protein [Desulfobacterales bacterium]
GLRAVEPKNKTWLGRVLRRCDRWKTDRRSHPSVGFSRSGRSVNTYPIFSGGGLFNIKGRLQRL